MKKVCVFLLPGSNCEKEMVNAVQAVGLTPYLYPYSAKIAVSRFDAYIFVGGFSFEDRIRAGVIASLLPQVQQTRYEAEKGKPVLGVCNGAQVLLEAGFIDNGRHEVALAPNRMQSKTMLYHRGFFCGWTFLKKGRGKTLFTQLWSKQEIYPVPVAHAEGRFLTASSFPREREALVYVSREGQRAKHFPENPNGSARSLAGVANAAGNVLAMMPHPERAAFLYQLPPVIKREWAQKRNTTKAYAPAPGLSIFQTMKNILH